MEDKTQQIEELQLALRAFLEKYPKNVTVCQDLCNFELSPTAEGVCRSILGAVDVILVEMLRMAESARVKH